MFQRLLELASTASSTASNTSTLLTCVRAHTEGKVYVELERAQATRLLAAIKESSGALKEAFELLQEIAVETFGSMERKDKYAFILEQLRLALATENFSQAQLISRKVSTKALEDFPVSEESLWCAVLLLTRIAVYFVAVSIVAVSVPSRSPDRN